MGLPFANQLNYDTIRCRMHDVCSKAEHRLHGRPDYSAELCDWAVWVGAEVSVWLDGVENINHVRNSLID